MRSEGSQWPRALDERPYQRQRAGASGGELATTGFETGGEGPWACYRLWPWLRCWLLSRKSFTAPLTRRACFSAKKPPRTRSSLPFCLHTCTAARCTARCTLHPETYTAQSSTHPHTFSLTHCQQSRPSNETRREKRPSRPPLFLILPVASERQSTSVFPPEPPPRLVTQWPALRASSKLGAPALPCLWPSDKPPLLTAYRVFFDSPA